MMSGILDFFAEIFSVTGRRKRSEKADSDFDELDINEQFMDDLVATTRFKSFLISSGVEISDETLSGLAKLASKYFNESDKSKEERYGKAN